MQIDNVFNMGDTVYLKTDDEQKERMVTGIAIRQLGLIYYVSMGTEESSHYDFELTTERDELKVLGVMSED